MRRHRTTARGVLLLILLFGVAGPVSAANPTGSVPTLIFDEVDVGIGSGKSRIWTCDLTHRYIDINGSYRT